MFFFLVSVRPVMAQGPDKARRKQGKSAAAYKGKSIRNYYITQAPDWPQERLQAVAG